MLSPVLGTGDKTQPGSSGTHTDPHNPITPSTVGAWVTRSDQPSGGVCEGFPEEVPTLQNDEAFGQWARQSKALGQRTVHAKACRRSRPRVAEVTVWPGGETVWARHSDKHCPCTDREIEAQRMT